MNYIASIQDFFKSPKWVMNLLFSGICILIPFVGPIVLMGWHITGFWTREDKRPETFPDFDFGKFSKYLQLGLWPFLVVFVAVMVLVVGIMIIASIPSVILGLMAGDDGGGFIGLLLALFWLLVYAVIWLALVLVAPPLTIKGILTQDFMPALDLKFVKRFCTVMWKEIVIGALFLFAASMALSIVGLIALCIGVYFAMGLVHYSWMHLVRQEYDLYLSRGGDAVPVSPKLSDPALIG
jgi:hypothetical protein